jgi:hypothetical protein
LFIDSGSELAVGNHQRVSIPEARKPMHQVDALARPPDQQWGKQPIAFWLGENGFGPALANLHKGKRSPSSSQLIKDVLLNPIFHNNPIRPADSLSVRR